MLCGRASGTTGTATPLATAEIGVGWSEGAGRTTGAVEMHRIFKQVSWLWCPVGGQQGCAVGSGAAVMAAQAIEVKTNTNTSASAGMILAPIAPVFALSGISLTTLARDLPNSEHLEVP